MTTNDQPLAPRSFRLQRHDGAALVVILAFVVLVSGLVVAFFSRVLSERKISDSSANQTKVEVFAQGALNTIVGDLKQEIAAGSIATSPGVGSPVFLPVSPQAAVPALSGTGGLTGFAPNLLKRSAFGQASFSGTSYNLSNNTIVGASTTTITYAIPNRASSASTTGTSLNGRTVSLARWNKPLLLPKKNPASATDLTPDTTQFAAPDWILVARDGSNNPTAWNANMAWSATNASTVVGRYAYAVYDEGGLLDANVAGGPTGLSSDATGNRGCLALAGGTNILTAAQWNTLVAWRNATTATTGSNYVNAVLSNSNGFLAVSGVGDRAFLSRQELIKFIIGTLGFSGTAGGLQCLGTFSREVNAPAYTTAIPNLLNLRYTASGTVNAGCTLLPVRAVQAGDFLLSRRFPLSRLSWVGCNGPANGASAYDVWRAFGLVWNSATLAWDYVSGSGSVRPTPGAASVKTTIQTLAQVAQENPPREPDFFELLQAGILAGSLGQTGDNAVSASVKTGQTACGGIGDTWNYDAIKAYQIIQIGANLIDQVDADSFPTAINFGPDATDVYANTATSPRADSYGDAAGSPRTFYGVENLPYFSRITVVPARWINPPAPLSNNDKVSSGAFPGRSDYKNPYVGVWTLFQLWNPHQTDPNPNTSYPAAIRVIGLGSAQAHLSLSSTGGRCDVYGAATAWTTSNPAIMELNLNKTSFAEPGLVSYNDVVLATSSSNSAIKGSDVSYGSGNDFAGLYISSVYAPDWAWSASKSGTKMPVVTSGSTSDPILLSWTDAQGDILSPGGNTYALQYKDASGNWRTYSAIKNHLIELHGSGSPTATASQIQPTWSTVMNYPWYAVRVDPRTDRFSMSRGVSNDNSMSAGLSIRSSPAANGYGSTTSLPFTSSGATWMTTSGTLTLSGPMPSPCYMGALIENRSTSPIRYLDSDGVLRRGDGAYDVSGNASGQPGVPNTQSSNGTVNLARPIVLNRPFRSVGEMGFAGRDLPWKTLDFFTKESGDAALLDLFSVSDADVVAGRVNINTRNTEVLAAALQGGALNPLYTSGPNPLSMGQARGLATAMAAVTKTNPVRSRADLVTGILDPNSGETLLTTSTNAFQSTGDVNSKIQREAGIRALAETGNVRTWNLLIDVIAQCGRYPQRLGAGASLDRFVVEGEKRFWLHVAIDRYTGKIVDQLLEPVEE